MERICFRASYSLSWNRKLQIHLVKTAADTMKWVVYVYEELRSQMWYYAEGKESVLNK